MFGKLGAPEIVLLLVVTVLLFGAKRLPGIARSLGQSLRIIKSETSALRETGPADTTSSAQTAHGLRLVPDDARAGADTGDR
ncbi:Sec-independent protein translocase subunit TatA [Streptomyces sp. NPDC005813]|uniref:Sec-independent protein translocase subunit TatA n=1 Tax=Streptomyces sp. NPDC005813 TaxID=3155592 RepID=UPI0033EA9A9E